jgi:galactokinase/mevalonate kinase-like predicted kinase
LDILREINKGGYPVGMFTNFSKLTPDMSKAIIEENLLLYFTNITRQADSILAEQKENIEKNIKELAGETGETGKGNEGRKEQVSKQSAGTS